MVKNWVEKNYPDEEIILLPEGFDPAFLGVAYMPEVGEYISFYSCEKCIDCLMRDEEYKMSFSDALDYFEYNIRGSYVGIKSPVFLDTME